MRVRKRLLLTILITLVVLLGALGIAAYGGFSITGAIGGLFGGAGSAVGFTEGLSAGWESLTRSPYEPLPTTEGPPVIEMQEMPTQTSDNPNLRFRGKNPVDPDEAKGLLSEGQSSNDPDPFKMN